MVRALIGLLIVAAVVAAEGQEVVISSVIPIHVETSDDGTTSNLILKYEGVVIQQQWQTGSPSRPLTGQIADTRQCHWKITVYIEREVCGTPGPLGEPCFAQWSKVLPFQEKSGDGEPFSFPTQLQGENCGKAAGRIRADYENAKSQLVQQFPLTTAADVETLKSQLGH